MSAPASPAPLLPAPAATPAPVHVPHARRVHLCAPHPFRPRHGVRSTTVAPGTAAGSAPARSPASRTAPTSRMCPCSQHPPASAHQLRALPGVQAAVEPVGQDRERLQAPGTSAAGSTSSTPGPVSSTRASARYRSSPSPSRPSGVRRPVAPVEHGSHRAVAGRSSAQDVVRPGPRSRPADRGDEQARAGCAHSVRVRQQHVGEVVAAAAAAGRRPTGTGGAHRGGPRVAGEDGAQGDHHLFGGGEHLPLPRRSAPRRAAAAARCRAGRRAAGARVTGAAPAVCQAACTVRRPGSRRAVSSRVDPAAGQPFADDAQVGLGLHGEVEADRADGPVDGAADAEAAAPLGVGPRALRDAGGRIGEHLRQVGAGSRAGRGRRRRARTVDFAAAAGPGEERERARAGTRVRRVPAKAESRSSVTAGRGPAWGACSSASGRGGGSEGLRRGPGNGLAGGTYRGGAEGEGGAAGAAAAGSELRGDGHAADRRRGCRR